MFKYGWTAAAAAVVVLHLHTPREMHDPHPRGANPIAPLIGGGNNTTLKT